MRYGLSNVMLVKMQITLRSVLHIFSSESVVKRSLRVNKGETLMADKRKGDI